MSAYDRIARLYDPWSVSVVEDVEFYVAEAVRSGGPVLELGVGTGRIAVPIAQAGIRIVGVDSSEGMLAVAREQAARVGVELDLRFGDLRDPPVAEEFALVVIPFRTLLPTVTTFSLDPFWVGTYSVQNLLPSPAPHELLVDLGPTLVPARSGRLRL